ncbi:unnamed protein product [Rotaria magnacalcarata]|uniref:cyclin-dependent kinase n=2 Tax=Rotaria magnacalcarata TaxID=392030 RepID=A0A816ZH47_9BILA|nr:unnamed protein product [Rotaria magnacalcarata]
MKHIPSHVKDKYEILSVIGEGSYGVVLKARKKDTNTTVAIKHFKQAPGYCTDMDIIERELKILQSLRFVNVVELIEWFRDKKQCFLVFEYVEWNMLQVLQEHPDGLALEQVRQLSYQLFSAIHWCHTHEIIHRDIKPENLLISKNFVLKLCDFGFARFCNTQTPADYYTDYVATRWYRSPELLIGSPYGKPVDIWACGCIMAELTTGQALFAGESDIDQLYRIQKCLGPLPPKYMEAMKINPKFDGLKFPPIHHLETLERRYGHIFPSDIMHLFKATLRLYAPDRLTAEACIQHEAFVCLNQKQQQQQQQKRLQRQQQQQHRPKTVLGSISTSQGQHEQNNDMTSFSIPLVDSRLSKWFDENGEIQSRRRSPTIPGHNGIDNSTDVSFVASSSVIHSQTKHRSNTQLTDRSSNSHHHRPQSKFVRAQSRNHSSSSDERIQITAVSPLSSNNTSDDDDDPNSILSHHSRLRRKYVKSRQPTPPGPQPPSISRQQSFRDQQQQIPLPPTSPSFRCASNGVLLRPKHNQQSSTHIFHKSSKDMGKKLKRFTLDTVENRWHHPYQTSSNQHISESNIYRSSMAIVPNVNTNVYNIQINNNNNNSSSLSFKHAQLQQRDESINESQHRPKTRDLVRSRTIDCHPPSIETTPLLQRTPSRQNIVSHYQMIAADPMDQADVDTTVSTTYSTSRSMEQQQQQQLQQQQHNNNNNNKYPWTPEQRKSVYVSDSHIINPNGHNSSFSRQCYSPTRSDYAHVSKIVMAPQRDPTHDLIKSAKSLVKQNATTFPKTPTESNRRQQSNNNLYGVYPYARTAILHVANTVMPTSFQRQQSIRLPSTKSRHHDR